MSKPERSNYRIFLLYLGVILVVVCQTGVVKSGRVPEASISLYVDGHETRIPRDNILFEDVQREIEAFLTSANDAMFELVTPETIAKVKKGEAVELRFSELKTLRLNNPLTSSRTLQVDRILISLKGAYAPRSVFFGANGYSSGPYLNDTGSARVKKLQDLIKRL